MDLAEAPFPLSVAIIVVTAILLMNEHGQKCRHSEHYELIFASKRQYLKRQGFHEYHTIFRQVTRYTILMPMKLGWKSVTLKEETIEAIKKTAKVPESASLQDALEKMIVIVEEWRKKNIWDNWSKTPEEVEHRRFETENPQVR